MYVFKVRVGVVVIHENRLLLLRQNDRPFWVLPGGTLEPDESLADCARREIQEETSLDIIVGRLLYAADFIRTEPPEYKPKHTIDVFFLAEEVHGEARLQNLDTGENINEMGFFTRPEVEAMDIQPSLVKTRLLRDWATGFNQLSDDVYLGLYQNG